MKRIGWVGLGRIGAPMAERLLSAGYDVQSYDLDPRASVGLRAGSVAEAARQAECVLLCLPDDLVVERVAFGPHGIAREAAPGTIIVDHSSISPDRTREFAKRAAEVGLTWVDAPISGGPDRARAGTLVAWLGGDDNAVAAVRPLIAAFADRIWHLGPVGAGQIAKSCNQAIVCVTVAAWAEMLQYAGEMGLDREQVVAALDGAGADSATARNFAAGMARGSFPPLSERNFRKDLSIVRKLAADAGAPMPLADVAAAMFARGIVGAEIVMSELEIDVADDIVAIVGEGPIWDHRTQSLYWIDVRGPTIFRLDNDGHRTEWTWPVALGMLALAPGNKLVVGGASGFWLFDPENGESSLLADPEAGRGLRQNDGRVDRRGRLWSGSLKDGEPRQGRLWLLAAGVPPVARLDGLSISNGLAWSPDGRTLYFTDSALGLIEQFDFDVAEARISNRREFARVPVGRGVSDGMTIDSDGCLWVAHAHGWCVARYTPAGKIDRVVNLPVRMVTSCAFGGRDRDVLYITTGTRPLSPKEREQQPLAGRLLAVRPGVAGLPETEFGGG